MHVQKQKQAIVQWQKWIQKQGQIQKPIKKWLCKNSYSYSYRNRVMNRKMHRYRDKSRCSNIPPAPGQRVVQIVRSCFILQLLFEARGEYVCHGVWNMFKSLRHHLSLFKLFPAKLRNNPQTQLWFEKVNSRFSRIIFPTGMFFLLLLLSYKKFFWEADEKQELYFVNSFVTLWGCSAPCSFGRWKHISICDTVLPFIRKTPKEWLQHIANWHWHRKSYR